MTQKLTRVVTSCRSRFWIFEQARELARLELLHQLITDYPRSQPVRFGIPADKIRPLLFSGLINHGLGRVINYLPTSQRNLLNQWVHNRFSRQLAKLIPSDTQFFIGISSFCLEALVACRKKGIPCVVDHASLHMEDERRLIAEEAQRWGLPVPGDVCPDWVIEKERSEFEVADRVFVPSCTARDSLLHCGVPKGKIFVNSYGVDISAFHPSAEEPKTFRVIQAGHVCMRKGTLTLLDAFARARLPRAELLVLGGGIEVSGMQETIEKMSSPGVFIRPAVPFAMLNQVYNTCAAMVLASVSDGFALVVIHAMACGLPVIVTENVGARDLIQDGVNGFIVPVGAPEIIADRLRLLYGDPERRRTMGLAALETVKYGYSWHDYGDRLGAFLRAEVSR